MCKHTDGLCSKIAQRGKSNNFIKTNSKKLRFTENTLQSLVYLFDGKTKHIILNVNCLQDRLYRFIDDNPPDDTDVNS